MSSRDNIMKIFIPILAVSLLLAPFQGVSAQTAVVNNFTNSYVNQYVFIGCDSADCIGLVEKYLNPFCGFR